MVTVVTGTGTGTATAAPATAAGDPSVISNWNTIAVTTLSGDTSKQAVEDFLYMGFVQAAVYDAVVGVEGRYAPYRFHARARAWNLLSGGGGGGRPRSPGDLCAVRAG